MMMRQRYVERLLLVGLLLMGMATAVLAQPGNGGRDAVRNEMDRTKEMLDRAVEVTRSSDCPQAALLLEAADKFQQQSEDFFRDNKLIEAHKMTQQARDQIRAALANCRTSEQGEPVAQRSLEKAQELLDRAGNALLDNNNPNLQAIYEAARDNLTRAWEFYRQKQYKPSVKLGEQVEKMAWKILGADNRQDQRAETYDRRRENVARILEQARATVGECGSGSAQDLLTSAEDMFAKAEQLRADSQVPAALAALVQARTLATRSINDCESNAGLELRYQRLASRQQALRERAGMLEEPARGQMTSVLDQAAQQLTLAQDHLAKGQTDQALAALQGAQLMLRQAEAYLP
jgi:hypothetical protein